MLVLLGYTPKRYPLDMLLQFSLLIEKNYIPHYVNPLASYMQHVIARIKINICYFIFFIFNLNYYLTLKSHIYGVLGFWGHLTAYLN